MRWGIFAVYIYMLPRNISYLLHPPPNNRNHPQHPIILPPNPPRRLTPSRHHPKAPNHPQPRHRSSNPINHNPSPPPRLPPLLSLLYPHLLLLRRPPPIFGISPRHMPTSHPYQRRKTHRRNDRMCGESVTHISEIDGSCSSCRKLGDCAVQPHVSESEGKEHVTKLTRLGNFRPEVIVVVVGFVIFFPVV